ncbi:U-box domain-containing protein 8-like [Miscanthus floridulus]|uniref:U-box domain-containing protein 8-like n=1 Tax=Miscanthus floridulus TaxID=154761 RepID=UPI003458D954
MEVWPDDFLCPITLEVMMDPIILPAGHTFEHRSIQQWLDGGHLTCLVTNLPQPPCPPLIPNHALRRLIVVVSLSVAAAAAAPVPADGGVHARQEAVPAAPARSASPVPALLRLAKSGAAGRRGVLESGNAAVLLRHAEAGGEAAARALLHLSLDGDDTRVGLVATTLFELYKLSENRRRAVREGVAPALADFAADGSARAAVRETERVAGTGNRKNKGREEEESGRGKNAISLLFSLLNRLQLIAHG